MITEHELDLVNQPPHYNKSSIECIHAIEAATEDGYESVSYTHLRAHET